MNKLVSKNPVQRFKEGKKIVKGENGIGRWFYNGKEVFSDDGGRTFKLNSSGTLVGSPNAIKNLVKADKVGRTGYKVGNTWYQIGTGKKATSFVTHSTAKPSAIPDGFQGTLDRGADLLNSIQEDEISRARKAYDQQMGQKSKKGNSFKSAFDQARNSGLQEFTWGGKRFNTMKVGETKDQWLANLNSQIQQVETPSIEKNADPILSTPTIPQSEYTFTESQLSGLGENPYYEPHPELRFNNFDRTQTRQWLRDNGFNPYSLTGAQRKALRMILNGQGTDEDKNLIGLTNGLSEILTNYKYLKQGGQLPSRNIVQRFKSQRIRK